MNIDSDRKVVHIPSPYDEKIVELNSKLNDTYISYGSYGKIGKRRQKKQDDNALQESTTVIASRAVSKSRDIYQNIRWDLVDAMIANPNILKKLKKEQLPKEMQKMSKKQRKKYVQQKLLERKQIQAEINELDKKRTKYVAEKRLEMSKDTAKTLDDVMLEAIRKQAKSKDFKVE